MDYHLEAEVTLTLSSPTRSWSWHLTTTEASKHEDSDMCRGVSGISFPGLVVCSRTSRCRELHRGMHATGKSPDFMQVCIRVQLILSGALTDLGSGWDLHSAFFSTMPFISPIDSTPSLASFTAHVSHALGRKPLSSVDL